MSHFQPGDHVVCPPHGAGTIAGIEERDGTTYLTINLDLGEMTLMLPEQVALDRGLRTVVGPTRAKKLLTTIKGDGAEMPDNHQHRARIVQEKTQTGDAMDLAELVRDLVGRTSEGAKLSATEATGLEAARRRLASELRYSMDVSPDEAMEIIDKAAGWGDD